MDISSYTTKETVVRIVLLQIKAFCFKGTPESFNGLVVQTPAYTRHTFCKFVSLLKLFVFQRSILKAAITVQERRSIRVSFISFLYRIHDKLIVIGMAEHP